MLPNPTTAIFAVSLGACLPRPSTRLGRINGPLAATIAPSVALPAPVTNSRRVRSFFVDIGTLRQDGVTREREYSNLSHNRESCITREPGKKHWPICHTWTCRYGSRD